MWRLVLLLALCLCIPIGARADAPVSWHDWHTSAVEGNGGNPVFTVDGKPFFVYGAAFFYERMPRSQWERALLAYRAMGINTIDLYLIWNWHEPSEGDVDFTGRTNDRRDLRALFSLIHRLGFKTIVRPGPVIRNEWRNGGYPAWLLERPEYNMPLHDVLEGRYPATATFQNAHADAAAVEWMNNATHRTYATRWLQSVLREIAPWSNDVIAIALDDDQGAYIDNDTWPAPHWHEYMNLLASTVRGVVGPRVPLFINTYQMKVTASSPVWAWGNWYQSDAYSIGDHDLAQLAFSTALLQTQPGKPVMTSEFQAGWLQGADEIAPRPADPTNTTLALHEMLQLGAHGIVNFPVQDTFNPAGWEAPWANWSYAWDAALTYDLKQSPRYAPTRDFGQLVAQAPFLASMQPKADLAIAWLTSAYDPALMTNARVAAIAAATIAAQQRCRALSLTCRFVDLRFTSNADLRSISRLVLPPTGIPLRYDTIAATRLAEYRASGGTTFTSVDAAGSGLTPSNGGIRDSALLISSDGRSGLLDVINPGTSPREVPPATVRLGSNSVHVPGFTMPPRSARDIPLGTATLRPDPSPLFTSNEQPTPTPNVPGTATATIQDYVLDGSPYVVLQNDAVRVVVAADAGARAFRFEDLAGKHNAFTTIGALRDDVSVPPTPSPRDYIARYTHPIATGTFNRTYSCVVTQTGARAQARCMYEAPDLGQSPVRFEKVFTLEPDARELKVELRSTSDAVAISAVTPEPWLTIHCDPACDISNSKGYRLVRTRYEPDHGATITFSLQGAAPAEPNRP